jgi:4-amino-4-deoxy-L-arabinose transferase-like glycosyltransferase
VNDSRAWRQALTILGLTTVLRLVIGAVVPLFPDETYYWDWSRALQPGYFDHPGMIALLVKGGTLIFGSTPLGVRFFPILAGSAATLALALTARTIAGDAAGRLAVILFVVMPISAAGFILATPDAPMLCALAWTIWAVVHALLISAESDDEPGHATERERPKTLLWWALAGLFIGCAMASKFTSVFVPAAIAIACLLHSRLQNRLGEPGPYLAVMLASLVLAPVLYWNWQHDWVAFAFQFKHGLGDPKGGALGALNRELELIGGQIGLVSPIVFYFIVRAIRRGLDPTPDGVRLVLSVIPIVCFCFFFYSATRKSVEANWPAIAWLPAVVLLASDPPVRARAKKWFNGGLVFAGTLSAIIYLHTITPILPLRADRDQVAKAWGWDQLGAVVDRNRGYITDRAAFNVGTLFVAAERYQDVSELAFHLADKPQVLSLNLMGRPNHYDLRPTFTDRAKPGDAILLVLDEEPSEPKEIRKLACCFRRIDQREMVALVRGDGVVTRKRLWFLREWTGDWPLRTQPFPWIN